MDLSSIHKARSETYRRHQAIDNMIFWVIGIVIFGSLAKAASRESPDESLLATSARSTQTAEIVRAQATGDVMGHEAETAAAITDITAVLDEDPMVVGPVEAVAMQLHVVSPLARGFRYGERLRVVVSGKNGSIPKGSIVTLRCGDDPTQMLCTVVEVATPTP